MQFRKGHFLGHVAAVKLWSDSGQTLPGQQSVRQNQIMYFRGHFVDGSEELASVGNHEWLSICVQWS